MSFDFTLNTYKILLKTLQKQGFSFQTFSEFLKKPKEKVIILRHDVDLLPFNSLKTAQIESDLNISGSYYFRIIPKSWDEKIILQISHLGHEIGYHYETLNENRDPHHESKTKDLLIDQAYEDFCVNLEKFRKLIPVDTICMHGSPRSKYDNRDIWKKYNYRHLGIIGEPYFDIDFSQVLYLTDTGRRWDGHKVSVRDKIPIYQEIWNKKGLTFKSTKNIIHNIDLLPEKIMIVIHPQRWHNNIISWSKEFIFQNLKNQYKRILVKKNNK